MQLGVFRAVWRSSLKFGTRLEVFKFYHLIVFSIFNVIYFKDARPTWFLLNGTGDLNVIFLKRVFFVNSVM
jgi:hypothetical protein